MATTTLPKQQTGTHPHRGRWIAGGIAIVIIAIIAALLITRASSRSTTTTVATTTVASGTIIASVAGSGSVAAAQSLNLSFQSSGTVARVLVQDGDRVITDQPLATIDSGTLQLALQQAQANLAASQAQLAQVQEGTATTQTIQNAQAQLDSATAQLAQTTAGSATAADITSARAQLAAAQAQLNALKSPTVADISAAERKVQQAQLTLQSVHDSTSQAKTNAQLALNNAVNSLTQAQSKYATAKQNWDFVHETGQDPANPETKDSTGKVIQNKLSDTQTQQYYDTFIQANAALNSAENAVNQAQVSYDSARQNEILQIQQSESALVDAQAKLTVLNNPSTSALTQAQTSVIQAQSALTKLQQGGTVAAIAQAHAAVTQAQSNLATLLTPATAAALASAQSAVSQSRVAVATAQANLDQATLKAPFAGVISAVNIVPGSASSGSSASSSTTSTASAISLLDRSTLHVDLTLSENDVAKVALGQKVTLTIDALKSWKAAGIVSYIAPAATTTNGVVTYAVRISFPGNDDRVKVGMTANLIITTAEHTNVLIVPASALLPKGAGYSVKLASADGKTAKEVDVVVGVTDGTNTEISSGLKAGDKVLTIASTITTTTESRGLFGGR